jgi:glycosyltransferase involved in cell wall biosynthesis
MCRSLPISVVIPVRNEEANLGRCLDALGSEFAEVLVVDSHSIDTTREIAANHGVRVVPFAWNGTFPKKRNWVLRNVPLACDWVLFLDADEEITPQFVAELGQVIPNTACVGFWLSYRNAFMDRWLRFGDRFSKLALFRRDAGEYERIDDQGWSDLDMEVHEHPVLAGPVGRIRSPILHRDFKGLEAYRRRHEAYALWEAHRSLALRRDGWSRLTGRQRLKYRLVNTPLLGPAYFVASYVLKLGFLDGRAGFWFAWHKMCYFLLIRARIADLRGAARE